MRAVLSAILDVSLLSGPSELLDRIVKLLLRLLHVVKLIAQDADGVDGGIRHCDATADRLEDVLGKCLHSAVHDQRDHADENADEDTQQDQVFG